MSTSDDVDQPQPPSDAGPGRGPRTTSGTSFVLAAGLFVLIFVSFTLVVSPRLQRQLGLSDARGFDAPPSTQTVPLTLDGEVVGEAIWDAEGICAEITAGGTYRVCADPGPLRPVWAIDAPDDADPAYVVVATPAEGVEVRGTTDAGDVLEAEVQARDLEAGWALIPLPEGSAVSELVVYDGDDSDLGDVVCGTEESETGGSSRLQGGCYVEEQD